jgi:hypothetical protein
MIQRAQIGQQLRPLALAALKLAGEACQVRNRVVHDMWVPNLEGVPPGEPQCWDMARILRGELNRVIRDDYNGDNMAYLDDALRSIDRARSRMVGLHGCLCEVLPFFQGSLPKSLPSFFRLNCKLRHVFVKASRIGPVFVERSRIRR